MSLVEEPSQENDQKVPEICLQGDEQTHESDPEDQKDTNLKTNQTVKRSISPLTLFKEDFTKVKEEVLKMFRDKDMKTEQEDNKPASSTLELLKEDLSQFKEDVTSIFSINLSKDKETKSTETSQAAETTINRLSNVFRIGLSKDRENKGVPAKDDTSDAFKTDGRFRSLFRRDQKTSQTAEDSQGGTKTPEQSEEKLDDGFKENLSEQNNETDDAEKLNNMKDRTCEVEDSEMDLSVSEEKTETQQSEEVIPASRAAEQRCEREEQSDDSSTVSAEDEIINEEKEVKEEEEDEKVKQEEEEEEKPETLPLESLSSGISLFSLRDPNKDEMRHQPGDVWSVKNFACYLTFDPNTANSELRLSDCNRKATRVWSDHRPSGHPDRFERCPQVLCREGLLDSVYWEVVWSGGADIGVTYNNISRDGDTASSLLGHNELSWSLECSEGSYTPCHDNKRFGSSSPRPFTRRVGVYLDWSVGSLSFYCVSRDTMVHLHTFTSTFTEPLYPGFWVWAYDGSVSLCQVELDWERLLQ